MKNTIQIFILLTGLLSTVILNGNPSSEKLDFELSLKDNGTTIDITVTIISGEPEFTYSIWEGEPWQDGKEVQSSGTTENTEYIFRNLSKGSYFILVTDKYDLKRVKQIQPDSSIKIHAGQLSH